jgi:hypothetical protein
MNRIVLIVLLFFVAVIGGCSDIDVSRITARVDGRHAVIDIGVDIVENTIRVDAEPAAASVEGKLAGALHSWAHGPIVEILNLPESWRKVSLGRKPVPILERDKLLPAYTRANDTDPVRVIVITMVFILAACFLIAATGPSGSGFGEGAGVTMRIMLFIALIFFCFDWNAVAALGSVAIALLTFFLSIFCGNGVAVRAAVGVLCSALFAITISAPEYRPDARWTGSQSIQVYVPQPLRGTIELLDEAGITIYTGALAPDIDARALVLWTASSTPTAVRAMAKGRDPVRLELGTRP